MRLSSYYVKGRLKNLLLFSAEFPDEAEVLQRGGRRHLRGRWADKVGKLPQHRGSFRPRSVLFVIQNVQFHFLISAPVRSNVWQLKILTESKYKKNLLVHDAATINTYINGHSNDVF